MNCPLKGFTEFLGHRQEEIRIKKKHNTMLANGGCCRRERVVEVDIGIEQREKVGQGRARARQREQGP